MQPLCESVALESKYLYLYARSFHERIFFLPLQLIIGQLTGPSRSEAIIPFVVKMARRTVQVLLVNRFIKFLRAGSHQRGVYCWTSASPPPKKINTIGMGDDIKRYSYLPSAEIDH